ncbi:MAG: IS1634 family transposase, partial [Pseudonocardiaceae bacterium]
AELTCLAQALERLCALLPTAPLVVADSALGHLGSLCAADRAGVRFVVPLRADTGWAAQFDRDVGALGGLHALADLDHTAQREQSLPAEQRTRWTGLLRDWQATDPAANTLCDLRVAYIWSSEEARSVAEARQRALTKAETSLGKVRNGLGGRYYKTKRQVDDRVARILGERVAGLLLVTTGTDDRGKPTIDWSRDLDAIAEAGRLDGLYALATNLADPKTGPLSALDVLGVYKDQWIVEQRHRDLKQTLRVRPVFLHNDDRIDALAAVVGIALLVFGLLEADLRARLGVEQTMPRLLPEGRAAKPTGRNILAAFQGLALTYTAQGPLLDPLTPTQRRILALLDIPLPWPEQQDH